jgi:hypothetical protein
MNLRDLMTKLDTIAEADDARAQYDKFKADDARAAAAAKVKKMASIPKDQIGRLQNAIDPKTGGIFYGDAGEDAFKGTAKAYAYDWYKKGQEPEFFNIIKTAGLDIINLNGQAAVNPQALANIDKPTAPVTTPTGPKGDPSEDIAKLNALVAQLEKLLTATPTKENFDIANSLLESFGYRLDELTHTMDPTNPNAAFADLPGAPKVAGDPAMGSAGQNVAQGRANYALDRSRQAGADLQNTLHPGTVKGEIPAGEKALAQTKVADNLAAKGIKAVAPEAAKMALLKGGGKLISKILPGVGLVVGTMDAIDRAKKGDYVGAGMAGLSAVLSLGGPLTAAASMGLDAANMARDYKATGSAFGGAPDKNAPASGGSGGHPAGGTDAKLAQLQKVIGANPDGLMGPETSAKLKAWQQSKGIAADGMPGPETYGKAGIKESSQTVAESIRDMQARLALIESKSIIKESLGKEYFLDEDFMILDENGEYVTDLLTIAVINENSAQGTIVLNELNPLQYLGKGYEALKGLGGAVGTAARASKAPDAAEKLAASGKNLTGLQKGALKTGAAVGRNPIKTALGATALGAGTGLALGGGGSGAGETGTTTGGSGGGGANTNPNMPPASTPPQADDNSAAIAALLKQIHELMGHDWSDDKGWTDATQHAQVVVDKAEHASSAQTAMDQSHDAQSTQFSQPTGSAALNPAKNPNPATSIPGGPDTAATNDPKIGANTPTPKNLPQGPAVDNKGVTTPDPTLKVYKENSEDELARWLRIARG